MNKPSTGMASPVGPRFLVSTSSAGMSGHPGSALPVSESARPNRGTWWNRCRPLLAAGLVGIGALVPMIHPLIKASITRLPTPPRLSPAALTMLALVQPTILMAGAVALGGSLAHRLGLRSLLAERSTTGTPLLPELRRQAPLAAGLGTAAALAIVGGDLALRPLLGEQLQPLQQALPHTTVSMTVAGVLGGGIFEELLMRWGVMTGLAWVGWRVAHGQQDRPGRSVMVGANLSTALLFGLGHLPATATLVPLTPLVVLRAVLLNGIAGVVYGWLFWRRSLEAAMISHGIGHMVFTVMAHFTAFGH